MGRATDLATLQFRMLNRGKGPAVWAPRAQCDRGLYRRAVRSLLEQHARLSPIQGTVARLMLDRVRRRRASAIVGIETIEGRRFGARAVVVTSGTFGRGRIHIGTDRQVPGGRAGEAPTTHLAEQLEALGLTGGRFKTGTPPRIDGRSVDFARSSGRRARSISSTIPGRTSGRRRERRRTGLATRRSCRAGSRSSGGGQADHRGAYWRVGHVRRRDRIARTALLPVGRRQDREISRGRATSALPRAGRTRHGGAVRQRPLDVAAGTSSAGRSCARFLASSTSG